MKVLSEKCEDVGPYAMYERIAALNATNDNTLDDLDRLLKKRRRVRNWMAFIDWSVVLLCGLLLFRDPFVAAPFIAFIIAGNRLRKVVDAG